MQSGVERDANVSTPCTPPAVFTDPEMSQGSRMTVYWFVCPWITNVPRRQLPPSLAENARLTEHSALLPAVSSMQVKSVHLIPPFVSEGWLSSHSFPLVCSEALSHTILFFHELCSALFNDMRKIAECGLNAVKLCYYSFHCMKTISVYFKEI